MNDPLTNPPPPSRRSAIGDRRSRPPRPRVLTIAVLLSAAAATSGCATIGHDAARDLLSGAQSYVRHEGRDSVQAMVDTLVASLVVAYEGRALPSLHSSLDDLLGSSLSRLDSAADGILDRAQADLMAAEDTLAVRIRTSLSDALEELVRANLTAAGEASRTEIAAVGEEMARSLSRDVLPELEGFMARAAARAADSVAVVFAGRLGTDLRLGLVAVADTVARVGARAAVQEADRAAGEGTVFRTLAWILGGAVIIALLLLGIWLFRERKQRQQTEEALNVLARAIRDGGSEALRQDVKVEAMHRRLEPWLHEYLAKNGYLVRSAGEASRGHQE